MEDLIKKIKKEKTPVFFVSPHLDDAALSCGGLLMALSKITTVTVINVFTAAENEKQTLSAKKALKDSHFSNPLDLYAERISEDKNALSSINASVINLNYVEALWRKIKKPSFIRKCLSIILPEFAHVYPTYKLHISKGILAKNDAELINEISKKLKKVIPQKALVFSPFGVGNHVDHIVTKKAVEKSFTPIYWIDQPYFNREKVSLPLYKSFLINQQSKKTLLSFYKTQIDLLFPNGKIPNLKELFVINYKPIDEVSREPHMSSFLKVLRLLLKSPREYLFSFTLSNTKTVSIKPHNKDLQKKAMDIITEINKLEPKLKIHFVGSASLGIAGQSDIDLMAESSYKDFDKYVTKLNKVLGNPSKTRKKFIEWNFTRNGNDIEFSLIDPHTKIFKERMSIYILLKRNRKLLKDYENLKKSLQGVNVQEYTRRRLEFFNKIMPIISLNILLEKILL